MGGKLKDWTPTDLSVAASKAAIAQAGVDPKLIDTCIAGIINQIAAKDSAYCSRHTALKVGMLEHTPALNINRMCGSGFQSSVNVAQVSHRWSLLVREILLRNFLSALLTESSEFSGNNTRKRSNRFGGGH